MSPERPRNLAASVHQRSGRREAIGGPDSREKARPPVSHNARRVPPALASPRGGTSRGPGCLRQRPSVSTSRTQRQNRACTSSQRA